MPADHRYTPDGDGDNGGGMDNWRDAWTRDFFKHHRHDGMRSRTPAEFRDVLIAMARTASPAKAAA